LRLLSHPAPDGSGGITWKNDLFFFRRTSATTPPDGSGALPSGVCANHAIHNSDYFGDPANVDSNYSDWYDGSLSSYSLGVDENNNPVIMFRPEYLVGASGDNTTFIDTDTWEEVVYFGEWNVDKMNGQPNWGPIQGGVRTQSAHAMSLTKAGGDISNLVMTLIQRSWYGGSGGKCLFYTPDSNPPSNGATRWVKAHEIRVGDTLPVPTMENPDQPVTLQIGLSRRGGVNDTGAGNNPFIRRFGVSVWIEGGDPRPMKVASNSSEGFISVSNTDYTPLLAIGVKPFVYNKELVSPDNLRPQRSRAYPLKLSIASDGLCEVWLIKNADLSSAGLDIVTASDWFSSQDDAEHLRAIAVTKDFSGNIPASAGYPDLGTSTLAGSKVIGAFYVGSSEFFDLTEIFDPQREQLGRAEGVPDNQPGDTLAVVARSLVTGATINVAAGLVWGGQ